MRLTESARRRLLLTSTGLQLTSLIGVAAASLWVEGFNADGPMVGVMVACAAAAGSELSKSSRPIVSRWLARASAVLTVLSVPLVLSSMFAWRP